MRHDGARIGGDDVLILAHPHHEGRALTGDDQDVRLLLADHGDGVGAPHLPQRRLHGGLEVAVVQLADQVHQHLGVGLRFEGVALLLEVGLQRDVVLDDAIVDESDAVTVRLIVAVRVGVADARLAVGGPAGVGDTHGAGKLLPLAEHLLQHPDPPRRPRHVDPAVDDGQACGVVAAILQPLEPLQQERLSRLVADIRDDSTHWRTPSSRVSVSTSPAGGGIGHYRRQT